MPGKSPPFTPSSILFRPRRNLPSGGARVEAPGTAPGSERLIAMCVYHHSRREPAHENIGRWRREKKAPNSREVRPFSSPKSKRALSAIRRQAHATSREHRGMAATRKESDSFGDDRGARRSAIGERRRSARSRISGSAPNACPCLSSAPSASSSSPRRARIGRLGVLRARSRRGDRGGGAGGRRRARSTTSSPSSSGRPARARSRT